MSRSMIVAALLSISGFIAILTYGYFDMHDRDRRRAERHEARSTRSGAERSRERVRVLEMKREIEAIRRVRGEAFPDADWSPEERAILEESARLRRETGAPTETAAPASPAPLDEGRTR